MTSDAQAKATATYSAAADSYDHPANTFWERFARRTIERLELAAGDRVLDVCRGSGASALPAEFVGTKGFVTGVDLSEPLLQLARTKAQDGGLQNTEFKVGDMMNLNQPELHFEAVVCVFGIFFVPDMSITLFNRGLHQGEERDRSSPLYNNQRTENAANPPNGRSCENNQTQHTL